MSKMIYNNQRNNLLLKREESSEKMSKEIILKKSKTTCLCLLQIFFSEYFAIKIFKNELETHFIGSHGFSLS